MTVNFKSINDIIFSNFWPERKNSIHKAATESAGARVSALQLLDPVAEVRDSGGSGPYRATGTCRLR